MNELIDRYVAEVARWLPRARRMDIARELRSSLCDALDARFGPSPSEADVVTLLKEIGSPSKVAASYQPSGSYLIGPEWYPAFRTVLRITFAILAVSLAIGVIGNLMFRTPSWPEAGTALLAFAGDFVHAGVFLFAGVVAVFFLLQRSGAASVEARGQDDWDPRSLPAPRSGDLIGRAEALTTIVATGLGAALVFRYSDVIGIPVGGRLLLNDLLQNNLYLIGASALFTMAAYAVALSQGSWRWYTRIARFAVDLFCLLIVYRLATGVLGQRPTMLDAGLSPALVEVIVVCALAAPVITAAAILVDGLLEFRRRRETNAAETSVGQGLACPRS